MKIFQIQKEKFEEMSLLSQEGTKCKRTEEEIPLMTKANSTLQTEEEILQDLNFKDILYTTQSSGKCFFADESMVEVYLKITFLLMFLGLFTYGFLIFRMEEKQGKF